jgi:hypothetical protein
MSTTIIKENGMISLGSIESEQDLPPGEGVYINPPPQNGRCYCCGRHISELTPFEEAEEPLLGDFDGAYLVKTWRRAGPYDGEAESAAEEAIQSFSEKGNQSPLEWMIDRFGKEKGERLWYTAQAFDCLCADWLCTDCIGLGEDEYFERIRQRQVDQL